MTKISVYEDIKPSVDDKILGTNVDSSNETVNFLVSDIIDLITHEESIQTLQQVTDEGSVTTNNIEANSFIKTGGTSSQFLKADGSVDTNTYALSSALYGTVLSLSAKSMVDQVPSSTNTPLQVKFGAAQNTVSDAVMIDSLGVVTFNQTGNYILNAFGAIDRKGASGGTAQFFFRGLINGVQVGDSKGFSLFHTDITTLYELTIPLEITVAGTELTYEVMRDSSGINSGGLYIKASSGGWSTAPSAMIQIWKVN